MRGVRQHILHILKERGQATVFELAEGLDLAPVSVRHHLDILRRQGVIEPEGVQRRRTRGRPRHIYVLTDAASSYFPDNYAELARSLLLEMRRSLPPERWAAFFDGIIAQYTDGHPCGQGQTTEERLNLAIRFLSEKGYLARWEPNDNGSYMLHVCNCPFAGLSAEFGELCDMDLRLVSKLIGSTPRRVAHAVDGDHCCSYVVE